MTTTATATWAADSTAYLLASMRRVAAVLSSVHPDAPSPTAPTTPRDAGSTEIEAAELEMSAIAARMERPPALVALSTAFGLSAFERDLVLICAGPELDAGFGRAVRDAGLSRSAAEPGFGAALAVLPGAHWSALAPTGPLRRWRLVEPIGDAPLTRRPLRVAERVVHFLAGVQTLDVEIEALVAVAEPGPSGPGELAPSHAALADRAVRAVTTAAPLGSIPLVQLVGRPDAVRDVAAVTAASLGVGLAVLDATDLPSAAADRERLARLWEREAVLSGLLLLVDAAGLTDDPAAATSVARFLDLLGSPTLVLAPRPLAGVRRDDVHLAVEAVPVAERLALWRAVLPDPDPQLQIERIAGQFALSRRDVRSVLGELALREPLDVSASGDQLWALCRERSRPRLEHLTDRVPEASVWADLVLPEQQRQLLADIAAHARSRHTVYGGWGFADRSRRGLGLSALFAGPSGTGKTMAAEALAELLRLDLYRIDLSRVVSKFIGETERNLGRIFDESEGAGGVILLFDEADALFGKRTEVRDSHDRYANLEVSYLLQRMEAYEGLAILTTNLKSALDPAFLRRLRYVLTFPFPDLAARTLIWQRVFPPSTPTDGLRPDRLARLTVAGGTIRTIALNAAFGAAESGGPVTMAHVLASARSEYAKLERPLTDAEVRGWL